MRSTTEKFTQLAMERFGNRFDYSFVEYTDTKTHVLIICNICGHLFYQIPKAHLGGHSCEFCKIERMADLRRSHGKRGLRIYRTWANMIQRCTNPKSTYWHRYGGRGIKIQQSFFQFENFYDYVKTLPYFENSHNLTLDRINNDKNYKVGNLRFATHQVQVFNQGLKKNNTSGYKGVFKRASHHKIRFGAQITYNHKRHYLGYFSIAEDAAMAYNKFIIDNNLQHLTSINNIPHREIKKLGLNG